jgi:hypothetical protein
VSYGSFEVEEGELASLPDSSERTPRRDGADGVVLRGGGTWEEFGRPGRVRGVERSRGVARPAPFYRFFLVRRLFVVVGTIEKVDELLRAGSIGAGLTVVLTLTFPDGVNVVLVRMRMIPPNFRWLHKVSLPGTG